MSEKMITITHEEFRTTSLSIKERLKLRQEHLLVAKDAELEGRWDLAMQLRDEVRIDLGWHELHIDVEKLLSDFIVMQLDARGRVLYPREYPRENVKRILGSTTSRVFVFVVDTILRTSSRHAMIIETTRDRLVVIRFNYVKNNTETRYDITFVDSAGKALSMLSDDERDRMQWM